MELDVKKIKWAELTNNELLYTLKVITLEIQSREYDTPVHKI